MQRSVHAAKTLKIPKQTQTIQNLLFAVRLEVSSDHLSGRHGEAPPISNSAGEFADIDAGEAADIEEGIRRRPSAPACDWLRDGDLCGTNQRRVAGTVQTK